MEPQEAGRCYGEVLPSGVVAYLPRYPQLAVNKRAFSIEKLNSTSDGKWRDCLSVAGKQKGEIEGMVAVR